MGLAISKRLAGLLRGDIAVASQPGQGSAFVLTVDPGPLADVAFHEHPTEGVSAPAAPAAANNPPPLLNCRILLAEDGVDNRRLISLLLRRAGAEVTTVENGREAMETALASTGGSEARGAVPEEGFDVILMDMQMPVMDGYAATRGLRAEGYTRPIVAVTAHAMTDDRQKCMDAGCDDYISKPIDRITLRSTIADLLKERGNLPDGNPVAAPHLANISEDSN